MKRPSRRDRHRINLLTGFFFRGHVSECRLPHRDGSCNGMKAQNTAKPPQRLPPFPLRCVTTGPRLRSTPKEEDFAPLPPKSSPRRLNRFAELRRFKLPNEPAPPGKNPTASFVCAFFFHLPQRMSHPAIRSRGEPRFPSDPSSKGNMAGLLRTVPRPRHHRLQVPPLRTSNTAFQKVRGRVPSHFLSSDTPSGG